MSTLTSLNDLIDDVRKEAYKLGTWDCATLALASQGLQLTAYTERKYSSIKEVQDILKELGFTSLKDLMDNQDNFDYVPISQSITNDIALIKVNTKLRWAFGVIDTGRVYVLLKDGLGSIPLLKASHAYRRNSNA